MVLEIYSSVRKDYSTVATNYSTCELLRYKAACQYKYGSFVLGAMGVSQWYCTSKSRPGVQSFIRLLVFLCTFLICQYQPMQSVVLYEQAKGTRIVDSAHPLICNLDRTAVRENIIGTYATEQARTRSTIDPTYRYIAVRGCFYRNSTTTAGFYSQSASSIRLLPDRSAAL